VLEAMLEFIGKRIIRIIVEALVFPEPIDIWRDGPGATAKTSKLADSFIADM
jgi:hypothetical protein